MNENKLIEEFWRDCDNNNFSKEATVLFYYLLYRYRRDRQETVSIDSRSPSGRVMPQTLPVCW